MRLTRIAAIALLGIVLVSTIACNSSQVTITYCAAGCLTSQLGDGICDDACNNAACSYDSGDCTECAPDCPQSWVGNGYCNYKCNNAACSYDGGDCSYNPTSTQSVDCAPGCDNDWLGNGLCNAGCNNYACNYDHGDCHEQNTNPYTECASGCYDSMVGNGVCNSVCNNYACDYDGGDCDGGGCSTGYSPATNNPSICCQNGYPYYWSSDGRCHTTAWTASTPITFTLDRIETSADCEPAIKGDGEFYFMVVVTDGDSYSETILPSNRAQGGYYVLGNYEGKDFDKLCFSTSDVGDYLQVAIIGFEQDSGICYGDLAEEFGPDLVEMMYPGWGGAAEWLLAEIDEAREGQSWGCDMDDLAREYENTWYASQNYGIGSHQVSASPYLTIWFTIE